MVGQGLVLAWNSSNGREGHYEVIDCDAVSGSGAWSESHAVEILSDGRQVPRSAARPADLFRPCVHHGHHRPQDKLYGENPCIPS